MGIYNNKTPQQLRQLYELDNHHSNLVVTLRMGEGYTRSNYRDLITDWIWKQEERIITLFLCTEADKGSKKDFHSHLLLYSIDPYKTERWLKRTIATCGEVYIEDCKHDTHLNEYVTKYIGQENPDFPLVDYDFYLRYRGQYEMIEELRILSEHDKLEDWQCMKCLGMSRSTFYKFKKKVKLEGVEDGPYGRIYYPSDRIKKEMIKKGSLVVSERNPFYKPPKWKQVFKVGDDPTTTIPPVRRTGFSSGSVHV